MDIKKELQDFIVENFLFGSTETQVGDEDSFMKNGILDSTGIVELMSFLEEKFGIEVDDEEMVPENLDSINNVVSFVSRKTAANV